MRLTVRIVGFLLSVFCFSAASCAAAQFHCAGTAQLLSDTNLLTLRHVAALPTSDTIGGLFVSRIAKLAGEGLGLRTNSVALLEPLVRNVLKEESMGRFGGDSTNASSFIVAVQADDKLARQWQENLEKAFGQAGEKITAEGYSGWSWKWGATESLWLIPARDWLLVGRGEDILAVRTEYLREISGQGRPVPRLTNSWLEADADWPRLAGFLKPAHVKMTIALEAANLRVSAEITFSDNISWQAEAWRTPVDLVSSPLNSFTAAQDVAAFLNLDQNILQLAGNPLTNQFYVWAMGQMPLLDYAVWPEINASNALQKLSTNVPSIFNSNLKDFNGTGFDWQSNQQKLVLGNLRVVTPALEAVRATNGNFLMLGTFARIPQSKPAPQELWKQIVGRTNLVYYDWERTGPRLQQWRMLGRMLIGTARVVPSDDEDDQGWKVEKWLGELGPSLGDSVTEITRTAPNRLSILRNSSIGLTGIELDALSEWLSGAKIEAAGSRLAVPGKRISAPPPPP